MKGLFTGCMLCFFSGTLPAQSVLEGYVFEQNNRGFLSDARVSIYELPDNFVRGDFITDADGHFTAPLAPGKYRVLIKRDLFYPRTDTVVVTAQRTYLKAEMQRKPGYIFDASLAEARTSPDQVVDAISGAWIEIYNRTTRKPELVLLDHPNAFFQFTFEQGNHYSIMIRKPGFIVKRIEARVNVEGCIICVDGVREVNPGVTDVLTANNTMGTLLSNIEMERVALDKRIKINNIYYDFNKWDIRSDAAVQLDKIVTLMRDNPGLSVELGSHTDARGRDTYNDTLSQYRAEAAVAYIVGEGVDQSRITAKGYGETALTNRCKNEVNCSESEHQLNRRTELRITGVSAEALERSKWRSLEDIIREEEFHNEMKKVGKNASEVKIGQNGVPQANTSTPLPGLEPSTIDTWKLISIAYSGFTVEIMESEQALDRATTSLTDFGQKVMYARDLNGKYHYSLGSFTTNAAAQKIVTAELKAAYPKAKVVQYKKGLAVN